MRAAILYGPKDLRVETVPAPTPGPGEATVRIAAAGLCGTDFRIWSGDRPVQYPRIMGHELLGFVEAIGDGVTSVTAGDQVAIVPNYSCGWCALCREGNWNICRARVAVGIDVDGGFAEIVKVPADRCRRAPRAATPDSLLLTEPLAVVVRGVNRAAPVPGETAAVLGVGTLGLLAIQVLRVRGARVLAVGRTSRRFEIAQALGAESTHAAVDGGLARAAEQFSGREGVDLVIETAGTAEAVAQALELVRPGGRVVLTGLPHEPSTVSFFSVVRREITLIGSMIYQDEFAEAMRLLASGEVRSERLVTHRFDLDEIDAAFLAHREPASIKVAVAP